jgi:LCP family protein required for cell wall assembly
MGWKRGIGLGLLVLVLAFAGWLYLGYRSFDQEIARANARVTRQTRAALTPAGGSILTTPQITIVLGSDSRGAGSSQRADSILLARTDPNSGLVSLLSIPRDLWVAIPGHGHDKINAAYAFGGPALLIRTVDQLTGLHVNHVVLVDFTGFKDLIDSLGGVTLYNPYKVVSSQPFDGLYWHFAKGWIHLDGRHALAYSRIRHTTNPKDSDITREERQQRVVTALEHRLVSVSTLLNLPSIGTDIAKPLTTDLTANDLLELAWVKFRASRNLNCHLGGAPQTLGGQDVLTGVPQNVSVIGMFLGTVAPQPPSPSSLYAPGCTG